MRQTLGQIVCAIITPQMHAVGVDLMAPLPAVVDDARDTQRPALVCHNARLLAQGGVIVHATFAPPLQHAQPPSRGGADGGQQTVGIGPVWRNAIEAARQAGGNHGDNQDTS